VLKEVYMPEDIISIVVPAAIALLIVLLILRTKAQIKKMIKNEIYANFPLIKNQIENFENRINHLKSKLDEIEGQLKNLPRK
jgi:hypothetical protein